MTPCILTVWSFGGSIRKLSSVVTKPWGRAIDVHKKPLAKRAVSLDSMRAPIVFVTLVALIIRLVAIDHGFPLIYHPDEPALVRAAFGIKFDSNPHHFDWPHLYFYLNYFIYEIVTRLRNRVELMGLKDAVSQAFPILWNQSLIFYLISRVLSAILGALTIIPIFLWTKKLVNKTAGIMSSALLALAPLHVRNSHYALVDVPMLFFLSWSLFFATFSPILAGLFLGFSASTKYNGILGASFIIIYYFITKRKLRDYFKTGLFTVIGFLIGTPYALLDYKTFIRTDGPKGALWQFTNVGKVGFGEQITQFFQALAVKLPDDLGYGTFVLFIVGTVIVAHGILKKKRADKMILLATVTFLALTFYVSGLERNPSHYYMIVYPYFFLTAGWALSMLLNKAKTTRYKALIALLALAPSLILSIVNITDLINKKSDTVYGGDVQENVKMF